MKKLVLPLAGFTVVLAMVFATPAAWATPAPDTGPTSGGTTVTDTVPGVTFTQISTGNDHSLAMGSDGNTYAWGNSSSGQVGDGTKVERRRPVIVQAPTLVTFTQVSAGYYHSLALDSDGKAYGWGDNYDGAVGDGTTTERITPVPVQMPAGITFTQVSGGGYHSLALGSNGKIYSWGYNGDGQTGTGGPSSGSTTPVLVPTPTGVTFTRVESGGYHSLALDSDGYSYAWGNNSAGQLGNNTTTDSDTPVLVQMPLGVTFTQISAGTDHSLALRSDGNAYAWGRNIEGQLGDGTNTARSIPTLVPTSPGVTFTQIAAGHDHSLALRSDGNSYAWGSNISGRLGDNTTTSRNSPVLIQAPTGVTFNQIRGGDAHSLAVGSNGNTYAWGWNIYGQVGDGTITTRRTPVLVTGVTVNSVSFGGTAGTALTQSASGWSVVTPGGLCGPVDVAVESTQFGQTTTEVFTDGFAFGTAAAVTTQPVPGTVPAGGGNFTATVTTTGDDAPTVQWQSSSTASGPWNDIAGAVSDTLTYPITETTHVRAIVTNCFGSVASDTAQARVTADVPVNPGGGGDLAATGSSSSPLLLAFPFALILAGGAVALVSRSRKNQHHTTV